MNKNNEVISTLQAMDYESKADIFSHCFSLGTFSSDTVNDKLVLISLISLLFIKMKEKKPTLTALTVILKITKQEKDDSIYYQMLETLSIIVEEFSFSCKTSSAYGLTNTQDIINKIKEILSAWIPF